MAIITLNNNSLSSITALPAGVGGKVLQVVYSSTTTEKVVSSATFVDTGLSASITPSATSSKILVICEISSVGKANSNTWVKLKLLRGDTDLITFTEEAGADGGSGTNKVGNSGASYLDSPNTTSSVNYDFRVIDDSNGVQTVYWNRSSSGKFSKTSSMTLMEIGA